MTPSVARGQAAAAAAADRGAGSFFAGTWQCARLILRRDRLRLPLWYGLVFVLVLMVAAVIPAEFPTEQDRTILAGLSNTNPAELLFLGRVHSASVGGLTAWRVTAFGIIGLGLASLFTVLRHTRRDEEEGLRELLGGAVLGRCAPLAAASAVTAGANLMLAAATGAALTGLGLPAAGSWALGLQLASFGWTMTAVAALAAQLSSGSRMAAGIGGAVLGLLYVLRGLPDIGGPDWPGWLSPFGWADAVQPYARDRLTPLLPVLLFLVISVAAALGLVLRRDVGAGLLTDRPGPGEAQDWLAGPFTVALRLNAAALAGWAAGAAAVGLLMAGTAQGAAAQIAASPVLKNMISGGEPVFAFYALVTDEMCQIFSVFGISVILRLRSEETCGLAESVLSTPLHRLRWAGAGLAVAAGGAVVVLGIFGATLGAGSSAITGHTGDFWVLLGSVLTRLPAVWVMTALAGALFGLTPGLAAVGTYAVLIFFFVLDVIIAMLRLDTGLLKISPFVLTSSLPAAAFDPGPLILLTVVALVLAVIGLWGFRRRDVT
ncbi:hypothetical protein V3C33_01605 [Micrococcaceae bacterium Sec5.7]